MKQNLQVRSANLARVVIDGQEVGLLQNISMNDDYGPEAASGIGDLLVQEHVPTLARHSLSVGKLALRKTSLIKMGIVPENGEAVLKGNIFDVEVFDKSSGDVIRKYLGCTYASGSVEINKHAIISYNCQLMAMDVAGEM
ncbi:MAG: hypothetical protein JEZ11_24560 [Desulfobacterales bacterium]|nr:hypothetical protein [Desulfobacterales bacterium]